MMAMVEAPPHRQQFSQALYLHCHSSSGTCKRKNDTEWMFTIGPLHRERRSGVKESSLPPNTSRSYWTNFGSLDDSLGTGRTEGATIMIPQLGLNQMSIFSLNLYPLGPSMLARARKASVYEATTD